MWDIKSDDSDVVLTLAGHSGTVRCLNLNGNRLVSGSVDRSIKVSCMLHFSSFAPMPAPMPAQVPWPHFAYGKG